MTSMTKQGVPSAPGTLRQPRVGRSLVSGLYLVTGGVHLGIVVTDTGFHRHFADGALFPFVRDRWAEVLMAAATIWGVCLAAGEILLGTLLVLGGPWAKTGWVGVVAFHLLLMLLGFSVLRSVPMLAVLSSLAVRDWPRLSDRSRT